MKKKPFTFKLSDGSELVSMARDIDEATIKARGWEKSDFNKNKVKIKWK